MVERWWAGIRQQAIRIKNLNIDFFLLLSATSVWRIHFFIFYYKVFFSSLNTFDSQEEEEEKKKEAIAKHMERKIAASATEVGEEEQ